MHRMIMKRNEEFVLIDVQKDSIKEVIYDRIKEFPSGYLGVCIDGNWSYFDEDGRQVIDYLYYDIKDFSEKGFAPVKVSEEDNCWRVLKENGELINIESENGYTYMSEFNNSGYAVVKETDFYYLIDEDGRSVDHHEYSSLEYIESKDVYKGMRQGKLCFINKSKKIIVNADGYYDEIYFPVNGLSMVCKGNRYGYINKKGKLVIPLKYTNVTDFSDNGMAYVETEEGLGGYINRSGEFVIQPKYDSGTPFEHGMAAVSKRGEFYYIYESGAKSINASFKFASGFSKCGIAKVAELDGRIRFIRPDSSIAYTLTNQDADVDEYVGDRTISQLRINGKVGLIDDGGEIIAPALFDEIEISPYDSLHTYQKGEEIGYIDDAGYLYQREGKVLVDQDEEQANTGIIKPNLTKRAEKFVRIYHYYEGMALAQRRDEPVFLDGAGRELNSGSREKELMALLPIRPLRRLIEDEYKEESDS